MENFAIRNVEKKAYLMLSEHADVLAGYGTDLKKYDNKYHIESGEESVTITLGYDIVNKFFVKTYGMYIDVILNDVGFSDSFTAFCIFSGMVKVEGARFRFSKTVGEEISDMFNDSKLIDKLLELNKYVDLESAKIDYSAQTKNLTFRIKPYAGVYMWLKFPPINKRIPLLETELMVLIDFVSYLKKYFNCILYKPFGERG